MNPPAFKIIVAILGLLDYQNNFRKSSFHKNSAEISNAVALNICSMFMCVYMCIHFQLP